MTGKVFRSIVAYVGSLSALLYLLMTVFGEFSVSEYMRPSNYALTCSGIIYILAFVFAIIICLNITDDKPIEDSELMPWGIVFYVLFIAVEWLNYGQPYRGVLHTMLPILALLLPAITGLVAPRD